MIPAGISTALVHMDAPVSFVGDPGRLHVTISPSVSLIWSATGTPLGNFIDTLDLDPGAELQVYLPHTDQPGFQDAQGNTFTNWYYTISVVYEKDGRRVDVPDRDFQILTGQDSVDLALIPAGTAAPVPAVAPILPVTSIGGFTGAVTKAQLQLERVSNTTDSEKPVSTAAQAALDLKAPANNPVFTGTVSGVSKAMVGLDNVDNTSDVNKPLSTSAQTALNGKANTVHRHTYADIDGTVPTSALPPLAVNDTFVVATQAAMLALTAQRGDIAIRTDTGKTYVLATDSPATLADWKELMATGQVVSVAGRTGAVVLAKTDVGLANVDNTSDAAKPLSTAAQTALNAKAPLDSPAFTGTPTGITRTHVGLSNVDNTSDMNKPVSTATQTGLDKLAKGLVAKKAVTGGDSGSLSAAVAAGFATFTFKAGRRYRMVWDASYIQSSAGDEFYWDIGLALVTDTASDMTLTTFLGGRTRGVGAAGSGNMHYAGPVTAYFEPSVDTTAQVKFRVQRVLGAGTIVIGGRSGEQAVYLIYDDGAQTPLVTA